MEGGEDLGESFFAENDEEKEFTFNKWYVLA